MSIKLISGVYTYWRYLVNAYGCIDFSSYFQAGLESRSVGLSRRPPSPVWQP